MSSVDAFTELAVPIVKTEDVGEVLFQEVESVNAEFVSNCSTFVAPRLPWYIAHDAFLSLFLTIIMLGATPKPCPIVAFAPDPV